MPLDPWQSAGPRGRGTGARNCQQGHHRQDDDSAPNLFDEVADTDGNRGVSGLEQGRRRRDDGMRAASQNTVVGWKGLAERAIRELADSGRTFTAEDVRERAGRPLGSHDNAMGAAIGKAARAGIIEAVGYTQAQRPEAAGRILRMWRGTTRTGPRTGGG